jgi:ElaB/YqjD/DUF883 family membrane-anchored ribosome-binding protein
MGEKHAWRIQKDRTDATGDQVSAMVTQAVESMRRAVEELSDILGDNASTASAALKEAGKTATDNLSEIADGARVLGRGKLGDLQSAVKNNPLAWVAAAAGVGLIIGLWRNRDQ